MKIHLEFEVEEIAIFETMMTVVDALGKNEEWAELAKTFFEIKKHVKRDYKNLGPYAEIMEKIRGYK